MNEDAVVDYTQEWLGHLPNVANSQRNQLVITGGLEADLVGYNSAGDVTYIVECKGSIGLNGISQGLGQVYQYTYQKTFSKKASKADVLFVLPRDRAKALDHLRIPSGVKVFLVSDNGNLSERVQQKQSSATIELQLPNTFYIRDCEINHFRDILGIINEIGRKRTGVIPEVLIRREIGRRRPDIAAAGYNHLITLRSVGVLGLANRLTPKGYSLIGLLEKSEDSFRREMSSYFYCFLVNVLNAIISIAVEKKSTLDSLDLRHKEVADKICDVWGQRVRFMYDPRTISTAVRILRELGAIEVNGSRLVLKKLVHPTYLP